jgi:heme exporter protein D
MAEIASVNQWNVTSSLALPLYGMEALEMRDSSGQNCYRHPHSQLKFMEKIWLSRFEKRYAFQSPMLPPWRAKRNSMNYDSSSVRLSKGEGMSFLHLAAWFGQSDFVRLELQNSLSPGGKLARHGLDNKNTTNGPQILLSASCGHWRDPELVSQVRLFNALDYEPDMNAGTITVWLAFVATLSVAAINKTHTFEERKALRGRERKGKPKKPYRPTNTRQNWSCVLAFSRSCVFCFMCNVFETL